MGTAFPNDLENLKAKIIPDMIGRLPIFEQYLLSSLLIVSPNKNNCKRHKNVCAEGLKDGILVITTIITQ